MSQEFPAATMKQLRKVLLRWAIVLAVTGVFAVWATWRMSAAASRLSSRQSSTSAASIATKPVIEYWTCTMHPQFHQSEPGHCPVCGMKLVEKFKGSDEPGAKPSAASSAQSQTDSRNNEHAGSITPQDKGRAWYRCTMPECGDQGSSDPNSRCPVCGMKRERVDTGGDSEVGSIEIALSERARRLAEVETEAAQVRLLFKKIRTVGRVSYDETRYKMVSAWLDGRIDKLFADFTGMAVSQGDHLVEIYSPELLSAQEEYLQAVRAAEASRTPQTEASRRGSRQVLTATRRKLELLGITEAQFGAIERSGEAQTHLVVYAPLGGTVLKKQAMEGMYVKTGDPLYTIADLRHLWLLVDLYESDLPWVKPFQKVSVTNRSLPGEVFTGEIFFVSPSVEPQTRTIEIRIHVANPAMRLKPEMWVTAEIDAALTHGGRGTAPDPGGEFACPMHPWETSDNQGICPVCEMALVPVTELPQYAPPTQAVPLLSVPRDAVMQTGERALVYVESSVGTYRGVEVTLGPLAHGTDGREYYAIFSGLRDGERVVTRGNFAIDSQMQLAGKPSLFTTRRIGGQDQMHEPGDYSKPTSTVGVEQTICPVMGSAIDAEVYTDYRGVRVYFCCPPCIEKFKAVPEQYIPNLPEALRVKITAASPKEANHD